ncbi:MAG: di-heme oxidoredictase family protein [Isosphaeraceae bacterium]
MPTRKSTPTCSVHSPVSLSAIGTVVALGVFAVSFAWAGDDQPSHDVLVKGADLFAREWLPNESKGPGGDGLGPVYNETSCIACHHQGGPGGAGPTSTNVEIMSGRASSRLAAIPSAAVRAASPSFVLHRFGVNPMYRPWRLKLLGLDKLADMPESVETEMEQVRQMAASESLSKRVVLSQRNAPALFGAGLIDAVANDVLLAAEKRTFSEFPEIRGRANRLKDGRIGRFGWKAETPDLREFVLTACANELGLEVPGRHQAASPMESEPRTTGLDLTQQECDALVAYVRHLPAPTARKPVGSRQSKEIAEGRSLFESAGCATCHQPRLGHIDAIYSDLLMHDMGAALSGSGSYRGGSGLKSHEWRTPPLWGFRDSAPYLHDGRAATLEQAVAFHGGEASSSAKRFFKLLTAEQLRVQAFLRSLAPLGVAAR